MADILSAIFRDLIGKWTLLQENCEQKATLWWFFFANSRISRKKIFLEWHCIHANANNLNKCEAEQDTRLKSAFLFLQWAFMAMFFSTKAISFQQSPIAGPADDSPRCKASVEHRLWCGSKKEELYPDKRIIFEGTASLEQDCFPRLSGPPADSDV